MFAVRLKNLLLAFFISTTALAIAADETEDARREKFKAFLLETNQTSDAQRLAIQNQVERKTNRVMTPEAWVAVCTGVLAGATVLLALLTYRLERAWKESSEKQIGVQTLLALQSRFDSMEMKWARMRLADKLAMYNPALRGHSKMDEDVLKFFDSIGTLYKHNLINKKLAGSAFGFYACRWWEALKDYVDHERKRHGEGVSLFEDFEKFAKAMRRPEDKLDEAEMERFKFDERSLIERAKG